MQTGYRHDLNAGQTSVGVCDCSSLARVAVAVPVVLLLCMAMPGYGISVEISHKKPRPGNEVSTNAPPVVIRDCSRGVEQLLKLGLPDVSKARYVRLRSGAGSFGIDGVDLTGNAWMLSETPGVSGRFVVDGIRVEEVYDATFKKQAEERASKLQGAGDLGQASSNALDESCFAGRWKEADPAKDARSLVAFLRRHDSESRVYGQWDGNARANVLIRAAHYHRTGLTNEANEIVALLLARSEDQRELMSDVIRILAEDQYFALCRSFGKTHDWVAYSSGIDLQCARFGSAWKDCAVARSLSAQIKKRIAMTKPPEVTGEGIGPEDQALATGLLNTVLKDWEYGDCCDTIGLWVLTPRTNRLQAYTSTNGTRRAFAGIMDRGMKSVPFLLALLKDNTMTLTMFGSLYSNSRSRDVEEADADDAAGTDRQFLGMYNRPATRAEMAAYLLKPLIPDPDGRETPLTEEAARQWYEESKGKTSLQMARTYLEKGSDNQRSMAMFHILLNGSEDDCLAVEGALASASNDDYIARSMAILYLTFRGSKAKPFVERMKSAIPKSGQKTNDELFDESDSTSAIASVVTSAARDILSDATMESVLADVMAGGERAEKSNGLLGRRISTADPNVALTLLLEAALKTTDANITSTLVDYARPATWTGTSGYFSNLPLTDSDGFIMDFSSNEKRAPWRAEWRPPVATNHATLWRRLLDDSRLVYDETYGEETTIREKAVTAVLDLYWDPEWEADSSDRLTLIGRRTFLFARKTAEALLDGKKPESLPAMANWREISGGKQAAAAMKVLKVPDAGMAATLAALPDEELMAVMKVAWTNRELNSKLITAANRIVSIDTGGMLSDGLKELESLKGKLLGRAAVEKGVELCSRSAVSGKVVSCSFVRDAGLDGVELRVCEMREGTPAYTNLAVVGELKISKVPEVSAAVSFSSNSVLTAWFPRGESKGRA
ncbi:MAG: hypothetical protein C0404_11465, partial [Verrucomicrobia bacterium]|nr:hypothetical protein [Verrucomicrobiota bacterium]